MLELKTEEQQKAQILVNKGMQKAADSLGFFLKKNVKLKEVENDTCSLSNAIELKPKPKEKMYFLTTYILGELNGVCYLVFTEQEAELLMQSEFPQEILSDEALKEEMGKALLLEMDNIISANVLTEFANALKVKIYGDVPAYQHIKDNEIFEILAKAVEEEMFLLSFKAKFSSEAQDFSPEFICCSSQEAPTTS